MLRNLTPHPIHLYREGEQKLTIPVEEGPFPRVSTSVENLGSVEGFPLVRRTFGEIQDLPDRVEGTWLIVSRIVLSACPDRDDLIVPDDIVRDDQGVIIGCAGFAR